MSKGVLAILMGLFCTTALAQEKAVVPFKNIDFKEVEKVIRLAELDSLARQYYSSTVGFHIDNRANLKLYEFIREWMGTPYRFGGNTKKGIDCSRLVNRAYESVYNFFLDGKNSLNIYKDLAEPVSSDELKEGDLVFFKTRRRSVSHIGIYLGNNKFVHSSRSKGVTISDLDEPYWKRYFYAAGRLIEAIAW